MLIYPNHSEQIKSRPITNDETKPKYATWYVSIIVWSYDSLSINEYLVCIATVLLVSVKIFHSVL